jgi:hypothetical protein
MRIVDTITAIGNGSRDSQSKRRKICVLLFCGMFMLYVMPSFSAAVLAIWEKSPLSLVVGVLQNERTEWMRLGNDWTGFLEEN